MKNIRKYFEYLINKISTCIVKIMYDFVLGNDLKFNRLFLF